MTDDLSAHPHHRPGDRSKGLPEGARVWNRKTGTRSRFGTVMPHEPEYTHGWFPVRWDDHLWERNYASDVAVVTVDMSAQRRSPAAKAS